MMTDEQLIERIRTALEEEAAGLHPPTNLLERLRSAPAPHRQPAFRPPPGAAGTVALLASVFVVAAVVVALVSLGQGRSSPPGVSSVPAGTPAGARALIARMAVLRRPQTRADRLPASVSAQLRTGVGPDVVPSLTRLAATINAGAGPLAAVDIYVVVGRPAGYPVDIVTTVAVADPAGHPYVLGSPEVVDEQTAIATQGLTGGAVGSAGSPDGTRGVNVGVVPDGVSRVKWVFGGPTGVTGKSPPGPPVTVYPKVESNVAVSRAVGLGVSSATWYGPSGRVIASYNERAQREAEQAHALAASARQPVAAALIEHFAIFRRPVPPPASIKPLPRRTAVVITNQDYGLNITEARFVPYSGTPGYWVIPGSQGVSMAEIKTDGGSEGGNVPLSMALSGGMITSTCCTSNGETVWGLIPDGNRTVTVVLVGGATRTVPVIDNVYSITVTGRVTAIIGKDGSGRRITIKAPG
jgi:hypothetical protein